MMKLATFNINGIKARIEALPAWLTAAAPDVVCLQEIKSVDEGFPRELFEGLGYRVETHGQKGFNGVAILSKLPLSDVRRGLPGDPGDEQARWIEAVVDAGRPVRVCGLYLPNGNPAPGPKYEYKLAWMARMEARVRELLASEEHFVCLGDYNVIPLADVGGAVLVVSQFTLLANLGKGRRPSFEASLEPGPAAALVEHVGKQLKDRGLPVENGVFGADMKVSLLNDGPVTFVLDSRSTR